MTAAIYSFTVLHSVVIYSTTVMQTKVAACRKLHEEAVKSFQHAAAAAPADARPLFRLGNALFAAHQLPQSQQAFSEALQAATLPDDAALLPKIHVNLGISLEADGQLDSACQHYRSAVAGHLGSPNFSKFSDTFCANRVYEFVMTCCCKTRCALSCRT